MFFHLILTGECNSKCTYCFGEAMQDADEDFGGFTVDYLLPKKMSYDVETLQKFCKQDPECALTFYGGEPLLCIEEITQIMDTVRAKHFMIQTNGLLLDRLPSEYVNRLDTLLVSIDGNERLTDFYRGSGSFRKVIDNMNIVRSNGFEGELVARMTVMEQTEICRQVKWLLDNPEFPFSSIHWQLNAGFWKSDFTRRNFGLWSKENYNPGIRELVRWWTNRMEESGVVLRLYPFLGVAHSLLQGEGSLLRCGGGWINYAIQTDGHIIPCPIMWGMEDYYLGHISSADPKRLRKISVGKPCIDCAVYRICGGRCLYSNITKRWTSEAYTLVCDTVKNLINAVDLYIPRIRRLLQSGKVQLKDFQFMKYNGCEIIP